MALTHLRYRDAKRYIAHELQATRTTKEWGSVWRRGPVADCESRAVTRWRSSSPAFRQFREAQLCAKIVWRRGTSSAFSSSSPPGSGESRGIPESQLRYVRLGGAKDYTISRRGEGTAGNGIRSLLRTLPKRGAHGGHPIESVNEPPVAGGYCAALESNGRARIPLA